MTKKVNHKWVDNHNSRLDLGEAWMWCVDCNAKLYSFDGYKDATTKCPTKQECEDERNSYYS